MIVWLASYPRSGNTFLRFILSSQYGVKSASKYGSENGDLLPVRSFASPFLEDTCSLPDLEKAAEINFVKTHDLPSDDSHPAIYIVRDGRDSLLSYAHFILTFVQCLPPAEITPAVFQNTLSNLMQEKRSPFGTWSQNVSAWSRRSETFVIRFEELIQNPEVVGRALDELGVPLERMLNGVVPTFTKLHEEVPNFFRSGTVGGWRNEFPADLLQDFQREHGDVLAELGYSHSFSREEDVFDGDERAVLHFPSSAAAPAKDRAISSSPMDRRRAA